MSENRRLSTYAGVVGSNPIGTIFFKMDKINRIMNKLEQHYKSVKRTTLNSMREKEEPWKILISCLISLRTRDENTEKVSKKLYAVAKSLKDIAEMPLEKLEELIFSSGYYKNKAKTLKHVSQVILDKYKGKVPDDKEKLLEIKGIGPKTANVVLNFAFDKLVIPVDANVHRIANRLGWVREKTAEKTEKALEKVLPRKYWKEVNALFILHGRTICLPRNPRCLQCPVSKFCPRAGVEG